MHLTFFTQLSSFLAWRHALCRLQKAFVNPRVQFPSQDSRGSDLLKERVSYSQMAAEREQAIHGMEMKQARVRFPWLFPVLAVMH